MYISGICDVKPKKVQALVRVMGDNPVRGWIFNFNFIFLSTGPGFSKSDCYCNQLSQLVPLVLSYLTLSWVS